MRFSSTVPGTSRRRVSCPTAQCTHSQPFSLLCQMLQVKQPSIPPNQQTTVPVMSFSFGFAGDDISDDETAPVAPKPVPAPAASAFPVPGKPQLPPTHHQLTDLLAQLPSKIAYGLLDVTLDDGATIQLPRRELWDVRVQLMAEEEDIAGAQSEGLGNHDVKTGVYEGGFKSWESSVDLVKVLAAKKAISTLEQMPLRVMEVCRELRSELHDH